MQTIDVRFRLDPPSSFTCVRTLWMPPFKRGTGTIRGTFRTIKLNQNKLLFVKREEPVGRMSQKKLLLVTTKARNYIQRLNTELRATSKGLKPPI